MLFTLGINRVSAVRAHILSLMHYSENTFLYTETQNDYTDVTETHQEDALFLGEKKIEFSNRMHAQHPQGKPCMKDPLTKQKRQLMSSSPIEGETYLRNLCSVAGERHL